MENILYQIFFGLIVGLIAVKMLFILAFDTDWFGSLLGVCAYTCFMAVIGYQGIIAYGTGTFIAMISALMLVRKKIENKSPIQKRAKGDVKC
ncbi:hypothetical protein L6259_00925 [Candidatus Parcubacteria bacterium]|nr:hypothetical protein [Patescibacteria group bacterium]MCG2693836.1 hypothetical protein [Candidatus Parcubacteria bacterium]